MKRFLFVFLALTMIVSLAACGGKSGSSSPSDLFTPDPPTLPSESDTPTAPAAADALELMNAIWAQYGEDDKFPIVGGDFDHNAEDGPGVYSVADGTALDGDLGLPASVADKVADAASIRHMMNVNTFTGAAFHIKSADDAQSVADALESNIQNRQWICGFPDKLTVILAGDYVISAFGSEDLVNTFQANALAAYDAATVCYDEAIG